MNQTTVKRLFALSGNRCAFPRCRARLIQRGVVVGEMCHINAKEEGGPRYDTNQSPEEREGFGNFVMMCSIHHKIIDTKPLEYPAELLRELKAKHESRLEIGVVGARPKLNKEQVDEFLHTLNVVHSVVSINQQGGQTAQQITNVFHGLPELPPASIVPVIESWRTSADNVMGVDYYDFRVKLRNDGPRTIRTFRLEIEVPNAYANPTHSSLAEVRKHSRGDVTLYRHTHEHFKSFILYPENISDYVLTVDYQMRFDQYKDASGSIKVRVYYEDDLVGSLAFPIAEHRNKDRMDDLGLSN